MATLRIPNYTEQTKFLNIFTYNLDLTHSARLIWHLNEGKLPTTYQNFVSSVLASFLTHVHESGKKNALKKVYAEKLEISRKYLEI